MRFLKELEELRKPRHKDREAEINARERTRGRTRRMDDPSYRMHTFAYEMHAAEFTRYLCDGEYDSRGDFETYLTILCFQALRSLPPEALWYFKALAEWMHKQTIDPSPSSYPFKELMRCLRRFQPFER